jgi:hypothetical protein
LLRDYHAVRTHLVEWLKRGGKERLKLSDFDEREFNFATYLTLFIDEEMDDIL